MTVGMMADAGRSGDRAERVSRFLAMHGWAQADRAVLAADASFRRYDRLRRGDGHAVLMDAPPPKEDVRPFLAVDRLLRNLDLSAPDVFAADENDGLLLLEDFGDDTYSRLIARGADETELYTLAVDLLVELHERFDGQQPEAVPAYDDGRMLDEVRLLTDWYLPAIGRPVDTGTVAAFEALWRGLFAQARATPATLVLRDYHVDNIMLLPSRSGVQRCGLLDFQDAVIGPAAYDLVSLLEDARRDVSPDLAAALKQRYLAARPDLDPAAFETAYAVLGAQRNLKIVGIFTRLDRRDGKGRYLDHIPRLWRLVDGDLRHPALTPLADWLDRHLPRESRIAPERRGEA